LIAEIRYQTLPDTARPAHVVLYALPPTVVATVTRVSFVIVARILDDVYDVVRRLTLQAAARVRFAANESAGTNTAPITNRSDAERRPTDARSNQGRSERRTAP
jgi:hypothetical protein